MQHSEEIQRVIDDVQKGTRARLINNNRKWG